MIFKNNIERLTLANEYYRDVLFTSLEQQLVVMSLLPHEEIGMEKHINTSQFIRIENGTGYAIIDNSRYNLKSGDAILIPSGIYHNIIAGKNGLQLYTVYSPPTHPENLTENEKMD